MPPIDHVTGNPATVLFLDEALFGAPPASYTAYAQQVTALTTGSPDPAAYANRVTSSAFANVSDSALAALVLGNLLGHGSDAGDNPGLNAAVTAAFAANPASRGVVVLQLAQLLDGLQGDATYGRFATLWRQKIAGDFAQLTYLPRSYTLTTGADNLMAGEDNDIFYGTEATLQAGDRLDGGAGNDSLKVATSSARTVQLSGFTAVNIEQLMLTSDATLGTTLSEAGVPDVTLLVNDNSSTDVRFTNVGRLTDLKLLNVSGGNTRVNFASEAVQGNADVLNLALSNNKTIAGLAVGGVQANGIEVINITSTAGSSVLAEVASPGSLALLNITGDSALSIASVDFFGAGHAGVVNAAQFNANLNLGVGTQSGPDLSLTFAGGHKVDTLRLPGTRADYTLHMAGAKEVGDTLANTHSTTPQGGITTLVNVERVLFADGALALDVRSGQSGYLALEVLGAALGANGPADKAAAGLLLGYFDTGGTLLGAAQLLLDSGYLAAKAGTPNGNTAATTAALVSYVYANVNGQAPLPDTLAALLAPIDAHTTTLAQWIAGMAASPENIAHVQLAGYAQTGLAYA